VAEAGRIGEEDNDQRELEAYRKEELVTANYEERLAGNEALNKSHDKCI